MFHPDKKYDCFMMKLNDGPEIWTDSLTEVLDEIKYLSEDSEIRFRKKKMLGSEIEKMPNFINARYRMQHEG